MTTKAQKRKPIKVKAEKYQMEPLTPRGLLIMYSKLSEIRVRFRNCEATARPVPASTQTSGT